MIEHEPAEEVFVAVLQTGEEQVAADVAVGAQVVLVRADDLFVGRLHRRRKQAEQAELLALGAREAGAFVEDRIVFQRGAAFVHGERAHTRRGIAAFVEAFHVGLQGPRLDRRLQRLSSGTYARCVAPV